MAVLIVAVSAGIPMVLLANRHEARHSSAVEAFRSGLSTLPQGTDAVLFAPEPTTPPSDTTFDYGSTPCPPTQGTNTPTLTFPAPPQNCLAPDKSYTVTFVTTSGTIVVDLDTAETPGTSNNFVFLARNRYYDDTLLFRVNSEIDIIQGGSPHTQSSADPGPGYQLKDEGDFNEDHSQGSYTYKAGDLVMARAKGPDGAGAQFFFVTGPGGSQLDPQGTHVVFGHVTQGLSALQRIVASADVDASGEGTPHPQVTVKSVTITET